MVAESLKRRTLHLFLFTFIACILIAYYAKLISITESDLSFIYFYNALIRISGVFILAWYCIISHSENQEKSRLQMQLSLPVSRFTYVVSHFAAYELIALAMATIASLPLLLVCDFTQVIVWALSYFFELCCVFAIAYLLSYVFSQATIAIALFTLIYVFARNAANFIDHANKVLAESAAWYESISLWIIKLVSLMVPKLEYYANSTLLTEAISIKSLAYMFVETSVYCGLLLFLITHELRKKRI